MADSGIVQIGAFAVDAKNPLEALEEEDGCDDVQVPVQQRDDHVLELDELLAARVKVVLGFDEAHHAIEGRLDWLFKLGCNKHANEGQADEAGARLFQDGQQSQVAVSQARRHVQRLLLVLLDVVHLDDHGDHAEAHLLAHLDRVVRLRDVVTDRALSRQTIHVDRVRHLCLVLAGLILPIRVCQCP